MGITYSKDGVNFSVGIAAVGQVSNEPRQFTVDLQQEIPLQQAVRPVTIRLYLYGCGNYEYYGIGWTHPRNSVCVTGTSQTNDDK